MFLSGQLKTLQTINLASLTFTLISKSETILLMNPTFQWHLRILHSREKVDFICTKYMRQLKLDSIELSADLKICMCVVNQIFHTKCFLSFKILPGDNSKQFTSYNFMDDILGRNDQSWTGTFCTLFKSVWCLLFYFTRNAKTVFLQMAFEIIIVLALLTIASTLQTNLPEVSTCAMIFHRTIQFVENSDDTKIMSFLGVIFEVCRLVAAKLCLFLLCGIVANSNQFFPGWIFWESIKSNSEWFLWCEQVQLKCKWWKGKQASQREGTVSWNEDQSDVETPVSYCLRCVGCNYDCFAAKIDLISWNASRNTQ